MIWYIYWVAVIATVAIVVKIKAFKNGCDFLAYAGWMVGQLLDKPNNNWRLAALFILSIVLTISAILAGFGRPILASSVEEVKIFIYDNVAKSNKIAATSSRLNLAVGNIGKAFGFTNSAPAAPEVKDADKKAGERYPSWFHWKLAILCWFCFWIYFPIATREELAWVIKKVWQRLERKKRASSIQNQPATTSIAATAEGTPGTSGFFTKLFPKGGFNWHMLIEVIGEYLPRAVMRVIKNL